MIHLDYVRCPFCNTLTKFAKGEHRVIPKFKCKCCGSWFEQDKNSDSIKYIATNNNKKSETKLDFLYTPDVYGVVTAIEIKQDGKELNATLAFAFGDTYTTAWGYKTMERFEKGINAFTLIFDHRTDDKDFKNFGCN